MFTSPVTQARCGTWPRYNSTTTSSSSSPTTPISSLTHQLSISSSQSNNINNHGPSLASPTLSSPVPVTPFAFRHATYSINPLASPVTSTTALLSSPSIFGTMGATYPDTPSPPSTYGINGGVIVSEDGRMLGSAPGTTTATSCIRLIPSQSHVLHHTTNPFIVSSSNTTTHTKQSRPALRPTLSHNAAYPQPSSTASYRRMMTSTFATPATTSTTSHAPIVEAATPIPIAQPRPSTAGEVGSSPSVVSAFSGGLSSSAPPPTAPISIPVSQSSQVGHEASAPPPSSTSSSAVASSHALATSTPSSHHHPHPQSQPHPHAISSFPSSHQLNSTPYADEGSFHTTSYPYDTSAPSSYTNSPWSQSQPLESPRFPHQAPLPPPFYPAPHPYFDMYGQSKQLEPILAPGEIPAPRPPMSYAALIGEALLIAPQPHHLYVSEISESIKKRYAYYRQNPSKIYNGVRHQTSMCKAFVKLPRPFGDQSGGARKWAIRAGCESWFQGGGYHPPGSNAATAAARRTGGKAKTTARAKQLVIGIVSPQDRKPEIYDEAPWSPGPSAGPAYDGSGRPFYPSFQAQPYAAPYYPPGFHYMPIPHGHAPPAGYTVPPPQGGMNYFGQWNQYQVGPPPALSSSTSTVASSVMPSIYDRSYEGDSMSSPDHHDWREDTHHHSGPSEHGSPDSFNGKVISPLSNGAMLSPHKASPEVV